MKRWIALVAALYPRSWRAEYGKEFDGLLNELKPSWRVFANTLAGGIRMHMMTTATWWKLVAATAVAGVIVGGGASLMVTPHYVSSTAISVMPQADPLRPMSPRELRRRAATRAAGLETEVLSRTSLYWVMAELDLYKRDQQRMPLEDILARMRRNIKVEPRPSTTDAAGPIVFSISFEYPDPALAQAAVRVLARRFTEGNTTSNRNRERAYRTFWQDETAVNQARRAPAPPREEIVAVVEPSSPGQRVGFSRLPFLAWGLGGGVLLGLLVALMMAWPRGARRLIGFAAAGGVLASAVSFAIPSRYTSTAVMQITPAVLTVDPLTSPPAATPATEFLREMAPEVLSIQSLSQMILAPGFFLYPREREKMPIEDVARIFLRDLHVEPLGTGSAFRISVTDRDRRAAQSDVQAVLTWLNDHYIARSRLDAVQKGGMMPEILQRKAGENLDVLDPPSLPMSPVSPNRTAIAAAGLGIGLFLGAVILYLQRPRTPVLHRSTASPQSPSEGIPDQNYFSIDFGLGWAWPRMRWGR